MLNLSSLSSTGRPLLKAAQLSTQRVELEEGHKPWIHHEVFLGNSGISISPRKLPDILLSPQTNPLPVGTKEMASLQDTRTWYKSREGMSGRARSYSVPARNARTRPSTAAQQNLRTPVSSSPQPPPEIGASGTVQAPPAAASPEARPVSAFPPHPCQQGLRPDPQAGKRNRPARPHVLAWPGLASPGLAPPAPPPPIPALTDLRERGGSSIRGLRRLRVGHRHRAGPRPGRGGAGDRHLRHGERAEVTAGRGRCSPAPPQASPARLRSARRLGVDVRPGWRRDGGAGWAVEKRRRAGAAPAGVRDPGAGTPAVGWPQPGGEGKTGGNEHRLQDRWWQKRRPRSRAA